MPIPYKAIPSLSIYSCPLRGADLPESFKLRLMIGYEEAYREFQHNEYASRKMQNFQQALANAM